MFAGQKHLDNLCVMVDRNNGQLDIANRMIFPMPDLDAVFRSFDWHVHSVDATQYNGVYAALEQFRFGPRNGKPTAIICHAHERARRAFGFPEQAQGDGARSRSSSRSWRCRRDSARDRVGDFSAVPRRRCAIIPTAVCLQEALRRLCRPDAPGRRSGTADAPLAHADHRPRGDERAPARRDKRIEYDAALLPQLDPAKQYAASDIVTAAMKVFARDPRVVSIDADLATTSGLEAGVGAVDQRRALNVGVAEANMMRIGEAFAALGCNTWISTFCPFYDWKVLRRIAVGHQERMEAMAAADGWLSEGHGLDLTMLATAANFETRTNGATHMGNDDSTRRSTPSRICKIIDVSCPQQMLVADEVDHGGQPRAALRPRHAHALRGALRARLHVRVRQGHIRARRADDAAFIVSSGRGVHEALAAARDVRRPRASASAWSTCRRSTKICCCDRPRSGKRRVPGRAEQRLHPAESLNVLYRRGATRATRRPCSRSTRWIGDGHAAVHPFRHV